MAWLGKYYRYEGIADRVQLIILPCFNLHNLKKKAELGMLRGDNASYKALYFAALWIFRCILQKTLLIMVIHEMTFIWVIWFQSTNLYVIVAVIDIIGILFLFVCIAVAINPYFYLVVCSVLK